MKKEITLCEFCSEGDHGSCCNYVSFPRCDCKDSYHFRKMLKAKVGDFVQFGYQTSAISCQSSHFQTGEGKVVRLAKRKEHDWGDMRILVVKEGRSFILVRPNEILKLVKK